MPQEAKAVRLNLSRGAGAAARGAERFVPAAGALRGAAECRLCPGPWRGPWGEGGVPMGWADTRLLDQYLFPC